MQTFVLLKAHLRHSQLFVDLSLIKHAFLPLGEISERGIAIIVVVRPSVRPSVDKIFGADF